MSDTRLHADDIAEATKVAADVERYVDYRLDATGRSRYSRASIFNPVVSALHRLRERIQIERMQVFEEAARLVCGDCARGVRLVWSDLYCTHLTSDGQGRLCKAYTLRAIHTPRARLEQGGPRVEVRRLAEQMEARLQANDHKPGWQKDSVASLLVRLHEAAEKLSAAICDDATILDYAEKPPGPATTIAKEAADVANFAMMIADNATRRLRGE